MLYYRYMFIGKPKLSDCKDCLMISPQQSDNFNHQAIKTKEYFKFLNN